MVGERPCIYTMISAEWREGVNHGSSNRRTVGWVVPSPTFFGVLTEFRWVEYDPPYDLTEFRWVEYDPPYDLIEFRWVEYDPPYGLQETVMIHRHGLGRVPAKPHTAFY